jgi:hypothetical protein
MARLRRLLQEREQIGQLAGMMGDRADVIFASPEEISLMVETKC